MKNKIFLRILSILIASAIFTSCSKENLSLGGSNKMTGDTKTIPVYNYGGISGKLNPVPSYAAIKVYNDAENFATSGSADMNGNFTIGGLLPATYRVVIIYVPQGSPPGSEYKYHEIRGVIVEAGTVTDLGVITLSPE